MTRSAAPGILPFWGHAARSGAAGAWDVRIVVDAQGRLDASYTLITPCPPEIYFCGTEENEPVEDAQAQIDTGQLVNPATPVTRTTNAPAPPISAPYAAGATVTAEPGSLRALVGAGAAPAIRNRSERLQPAMPRSASRCEPS